MSSLLKDNSSHRGKFLDTLHGNVPTKPPVWLMRQAGRYLPEYRNIRTTARDFLHFCYSPDLAVEATLQPIKRFDFDAAILFSDILVIPDALGQTVRFVEGEGPRLDPLVKPDEASFLKDRLDINRLAPVMETIGRVREGLAREKALIGFCGAPWTVATYMIAGKGTKDQAPARLFAYQYPEAFERLISLLVEASSEYLVAQFVAGVNCVQIFDSWAGVLPRSEFERWCVRPVAEIIMRVRRHVPDAPVIGFPRGISTNLDDFVGMIGVNGVGVDTAVDMAYAAKAVRRSVTIQGNLDPLALIAGGKVLDRAIDGILEATQDRPHIFNLGHGILPETPISHVEQLMKRIRQ